jgi:hypothetical protein
MFGGDWQYIAEAQTTEVFRLRLHGLGIHLVDREKDGLAAAQQQSSQFKVRRGEFGSSIDDHDDCISLFEADLCLTKDLCWNQRFVVWHDAARIDDTRGAAHPFDLAIDAVARDSRLIADDGSPRAGQPVEQGAFAYVWAAAYGNQRQLERVDACGLGDHLRGEQFDIPPIVLIDPLATADVR